MESWDACFCLVVENSAREKEWTRALTVAVLKPLRKLFTALTWDMVQAKIHEVGNAKCKKTDNLPPHVELMKTAIGLLDSGEEIPLDSLAQIIKYLLHQIQIDDIHAKQAEEKAKAAPPPAPKDKGTKGGKDKKGKNPPSTASEKKTKLKRRDEPDPPNYIGDEPDDGPQRYILLMGFYRPGLTWELHRQGVHVSNVIRLSSQEREESLEVLESERQLEKPTPVEIPEVKELTMKLDFFWSGFTSAMDSHAADSGLQEVVQLDFTFTGGCLKDYPDQLEFGTQIFAGVANLIYDSLDWRRQHQYYLDNLNLINIPTITEKAAEAAAEPDPTHVPPEVDMRYYNSLLDLLPPEVCTVPLLLHCMLEQVVLSSEPSAISSQVNENKDADLPPGSWLDEYQFSLYMNNFLPLLKTEDEKSRLLTRLLAMVEKQEDKQKLQERYGEHKLEKVADPPLVIRHHDERTLRLKDARVSQSFNPVEVESFMMRLTPVWELILSGAEHMKTTPCWTTIKKQLFHFCTDERISWSEVERLFQQSVFECMTLSRLGQGGLQCEAGVPDEPTILPWDDPIAFAQLLLQIDSAGSSCPDGDSDSAKTRTGVSAQLDLSDIQKCRRRDLSDWNFMEHHETDVFPQVLQVVADEYRCMDTFRGRHNNVLYVFCHNPVNRQRECEKCWDAALHSDVRFRKYLKYVADSISEWTQEEERKLEELQFKKLCPSPELDNDAAEEEDAPEPVIRKESLKAWKIEQERLKEEEALKKAKKEKGGGGKGKVEEKKVDVKKPAPAGKKQKEEPTTQTEPQNVDSENTEQERESSIDDSFTGFTAYAMEGRLIHASGRVRELFPSDGGHITVETINFVEGSRMVKVAVHKDRHHFFSHIHYEDTFETTETNPDENTDKKNDSEVLRQVTVKKGCFSAQLSNGIHVAYKSQVVKEEQKEDEPESEGEPRETPVPPPTSLSDHPQKVAEQEESCSQSPASQQSEECEGRAERPSSPFNSLCLSLPNGLLLQFLREDTQEQGLLVRQSFPVHESSQLHDPAFSEECSRIINSQGAVHRVLKNGTAQILFADSSVSSSQETAPDCAMDFAVEVAIPQDLNDPNNDNGSVQDEALQGGWWLTTTPSGGQFWTTGNTWKPFETTPIQACKATDPITFEVMVCREDLVLSVQNPDGSKRIVEHADGTRITTIFEDRDLNGPFYSEQPRTLRSRIMCNGSREEREAVTESWRRSFDQHLSDAVFNTDSFGGCVKEGEQSVEQGGESVLVKERVVVVEKEGCVTVVMYPEKNAVHIFTADGTVVIADNTGYYQVFPSSGGFLQIHCDGACVYSSEQQENPSPHRDPLNPKPGSYIMTHSEKVTCDITDPEGNRFQVMEDGEISVLNISTLDASEPAELDIDPKESSLRLFMVFEDGSATELLSSLTVERLLCEAYSDQTVALLKEPLTERLDELAITILKPSHLSVWSKWLLRKQVQEITPPNLLNRNWKDFPRIEMKTPGAVFGTDVGCSLNIKERPARPTSLPTRSCPKLLEIREVLQYLPFTASFRDIIDTRLKDYIQSLMDRELRSVASKVLDPRSKEETILAGDLQRLITPFLDDDEDEDEDGTFEKRSSVEIQNLYREAVIVPEEQLDDSQSSQSATGVSFISAKDSKWARRLAHYRRELNDGRNCRDAVNARHVVPYFHPENFPLYKNLLVRRSTKTSHSTKTEDTEKKPAQPLKPILLQTTSGPTDRRISSSEYQATGGYNLSSRPQKSLEVDVIGKPRRSKVRLPVSVLSAKPRSEPNTQFLTVEEPTRRRSRMISLLDPTSVLRGFQLRPSTVSFGTLEEGATANIVVLMKNVGVDTCRFYIKQPPPSTGLRIIYTPGPVPAGLHVELKVQLFSMKAVGGDLKPEKKICHDVTIVTESDVLYLPVTATVIPQVLLSDLSKGNPRLLNLTSDLPV
ncbi:sperm-associated antigen 17 [Synchiropus splendidus]|uniref:sperm-associated antigen 17 n=1 Tax=Synchiropus splendidus TaxID=270530 RepID=UPI00237DC474|nr:sperm-associated antigen 17 [Synchiropus splendidus]